MSTLGLQSDGSYRLERHEVDANCDALYKDIWGRIQLIKALPAKATAEQATPPPTAFSLFGRFFGGADKAGGCGQPDRGDRDQRRAPACHVVRAQSAADAHAS